MDETRNDAPQAGAPEKPAPAKQPPLRRVGSFTLGVCLIAAGLFFLGWYFVPGFPTQLVLKIAPAAGLVLLGGEVLYFARKPERWKYDFMSVLVCLLLMGGCFCLALLPRVWDAFSPERSRTSSQLSQAYTAEVYSAIRRAAPEVGLKDVYGSLYLYTSDVKTLQQYEAGNGRLSLTVELFGPYTSAETFAQDCRAVTDAIQSCSPQPDEVRFAWEADNQPDAALESGALQYTEQYALQLDGLAPLDWTASQMARETKVESLLDEENEEPEASSAERAEHSGSRKD